MSAKSDPPDTDCWDCGGSGWTFPGGQAALPITCPRCGGNGIEPGSVKLREVKRDRV